MILPTFIMPQPSDVSVGYLSNILGDDVVSDILGTTSSTNALGTHIFANMMNVFNHLLLGSGLLIFAILLFVGTMNTAADGQFLGREWHSVWTPLRLIFGILLVVPLKTGYCIGQYIILWAIFIGIHFATSVWQHAINDVFNNQDAPPAPAYLTNNIKQVLGEALLNLSVPLILTDSGIAPGSGSSCQPSANNPNPSCPPIVINVNDIYQVANGIPSDLQKFIMQDVYSSNGTSSNICGNLFSGDAADCVSAVNQSFSGSANNTLVTGLLGYQVNIGLKLPTVFDPSNYGNGYDPVYVYDTAYINNLWSADGQVQVYGAYVYNPSAMFSNLVPSVSPVNSSARCQANPQDPACQPPSNQGANQAFQSLLAVFSNSVAQPAAAVGGVTPSPSALQNLQAICNTTIPSGNSSGQSTKISPCDLGLAVQAIITQAQASATWQAFNAAGEFSQTAPQNAPAPNPDSDPYNVPPQGQAQALANNMYVYQDANGVWRIGYNLNDYWIPDINSQSYIDLQLNNSWWMAGSSYLVLDNALGQNLAWMAQAIETELQLFQNAMGGATTSQAKYNCTLPFQPDTNSADLTNFLTPEFCLKYGLQVMERDPTALQPTNNGFTLRNSSLDHCSIYKQQAVATAAGGIIRYYSCNQDLLRVSQPAEFTTPYNQNNIAVPNWLNLIAPFNSASSGPHIDISGTPMFYQILQGMPTVYQGPVAVLLQSAQNYCPTSNGMNPPICIAGYQKLYPYLVALVQVMQYNGLLSGSEVESTLPVNNAINKIFGQLVGGGSGVGNTGTAQAAGSNLNTVMQQVYNLGVTSDSQEGIVASQFSLIQQAQTAGISMIMACITSLDTVYNSYTSALQGMVNQLNSQVSGATDQIEGFGIAGAIPVLGTAFSAYSSIQAQQLQLALMTTTTSTLTSIAIQLMWLPLLLFILTSLFTAGVQFAILVPLMPYILFWAGQIAWLIGVIEAVVAAPLVMLGLAHPGGHAFMGHTVPAVKMLIGVMFRPVLMVIGLIVGILLTYIVINFSAQGFHTVAASILNAVPSSENTVQGIMACLLLFIYATFLVMAFQKCFSTIYTIPEQVVQWIGGQAARAGAEELQQISSSSQQSSQAAAQAGGSALEKGIQAQQGRGEQMSSLDRQQVSTTAEVAKTIGQAGQSYATAAVEFMV